MNPSPHAVFSFFTAFVWIFRPGQTDAEQNGGLWLQNCSYRTFQKDVNSFLGHSKWWWMNVRWEFHSWHHYWHQSNVALNGNKGEDSTAVHIHLRLVLFSLAVSARRDVLASVQELTLAFRFTRSVSHTYRARRLDRKEVTSLVQMSAHTHTQLTAHL